MDIQVSKYIDAPVERVFDVFSDITQAQNRVYGITNVEILSDVKSNAVLKGSTLKSCTIRRHSSAGVRSPSGSQTARLA